MAGEGGNVAGGGEVVLGVLGHPEVREDRAICVHSGQYTLGGDYKALGKIRGGCLSRRWHGQIGTRGGHDGEAKNR